MVPDVQYSIQLCEELSSLLVDGGHNITVATVNLAMGYTCVCWYSMASVGNYSVKVVNACWVVLEGLCLWWEVRASQRYLLSKNMPYQYPSGRREPRALCLMGHPRRAKSRRSDSAQLIEVIRDPKDMLFFAACPIKVHPNFMPLVTPDFFHNHVMDQQDTAAASTSTNTFDITHP